MNIKIEKIEVKDKSILNNLFQLYMHDISASLTIDVNEHGLFNYDYIDYYFSKESYKPFFIKADNKLVGFILIDDDFMVLKKASNTYDLSEMFILNAYKGQGIGQVAACRVFDMFKGKWEVKPVPKSEGAKRFWERVIKEYTNNDYKTEFPKPNRTTFIFNNENK